MQISRRAFAVRLAGATALIAAPIVRAQAAPVTVSLPFLPIAGIAPAKRAEQAGYFKAEGLQLVWENLKSPADSIPTLLSGKHQLSFINVGGLMAAAAQNLPIKVIGPLYFSVGLDQSIKVMSDSPIRSIADLKGKTIGLAALKNNYHAAVLDTLVRNNVDPESVKFTFVPVPQGLAALRNKTVDAVQLIEPFASQGADQVRAIIDNPYQVFGSGPAIVAYSLTTRDYAAKNPNVVQGFARGMNKGIEDLARDPQLLRKTIASFTEIPEALLAKMVLPLFSTDMAIDNAKRQAEAMARHKFIASMPDVGALFK